MVFQLSWYKTVTLIFSSFHLEQAPELFVMNKIVFTRGGREFTHKSCGGRYIQETSTTLSLPADSSVRKLPLEMGCQRGARRAGRMYPTMLISMQVPETHSQSISLFKILVTLFFVNWFLQQQAARGEDTQRKINNWLCNRK
jgi:hypothetical protein